MKIDHFKKYKRLAESQDPALIESSQEIASVYDWMLKTGRIDEDRIDEGILSSIWNWLKKNFSFTARRLHSLADDFEKELREELRAQYKKTKDPKDLGAKYRAETFNSLSRDIEEKMQIVAGDDDVYRELVTALINEKNLKVKKQLLTELVGMADPDDENTREIKKNLSDVESKYPEAERELNKLNRKLIMDKKPLISEIVKFMNKKLIDEKSRFRILRLDSEPARQDFIKLMYLYTNALSEKSKSIDFDAKSVYSVAKDYLEVMKDLTKRLERNGMSSEKSLSVASSLMKDHLEDIRNVKPLSAIHNAAIKEVEAKSKKENESEDDSGDDSDAEKEAKRAATSDYTEEIISGRDVKDVVKNAAEETGEDDPTKKEILREIQDTVKIHFSPSNMDIYLNQLNKRIEDFNNMKDDERKTSMRDYKYVLNKELKLEKATTGDLQTLINAFVDFAGMIYPYFQETEQTAGNVVRMTSRFLFEIYAMEKDPLKKLLSEEKEKLMKNMKEKYPQSFK